MKRSIIIWSIATILVLVAAYTMISYNSSSKQPPPSVNNGSGDSTAKDNASSESFAIDFTLNDLDENPVKLSDFRGKKVLLNFWATWCPPCRAEMPDIEKLYKEYGDKDLVILAVNIGEDRKTVKDFVEQNGYSFKILLDTKSEVANKYVVNAIPTSYFIDADGSISNHYIGAMSLQQMKELAGF